ncbi:DUF3405 domain-containing protein [Pleurostoma richardsiae]|uniref:DUF3405 domain-containing protein n=1 Tax=Pleurostoma richardsiae TaxID=41990 RepID=A0AA38RMW7_9PEZI|nr:DUF3405 domain-containing protein [Pleurostoma richardsiae]
MGIFSLGLLRPRSQRQAKLPLYEKISRKRASHADDSSSEDDETDEDTDYSSASSPSSRQTSSSLSSGAAMLPRSPFKLSRRPGRPFLYRLPNKIIRYLCVGLVTTIVIFIFSLARASIAENRRIRNGDVNKAPPPPPPWESFEFLTRYYGGVRTLIPLGDNVSQYPRPEDELPFNISEVRPDHVSPNGEKQKIESTVPPSKAFATEYPGTALAAARDQVNECFIDEHNTIRVPLIRYLEGRPAGFPRNVLGSYELLSLPEDICFERYGRYGPYGFGYSVRNGGLGIGEHGENEGSESVWEETRRVDYRKIDWAEVQRRCYRSNADRFKPTEPRPVAPYGFYINEEPEIATLVARDEIMPSIEEAPSADDSQPMVKSSHPAPKQNGDLPRTAIVVRVWDEFFFHEEDVMNLRSLITEAALASGARYDVHLLVQVRDDAKYPVWADDETYRQRIKDTIPEEFQGLATLWSVTQMLSLYQGIHDLYTRGPDLPVHGSYRGLQMAMQYFAYKHPEYDHFWQWEMDIRYIGHYYDLFTKLENWARDQPRKGLWERNTRFYLPDVHGTWEDFKQMARVQSEMGTPGPDTMWSGVKGGKAPQEITKGDEVIWGPKRPADEKDWLEPDNDPVPPTTYEHDKYQWGVGEEADFITLNPMFDPEGTTWLLADDITGYNETAEGGKPPRRAQIITASRMSRRLLLSMHRETAFKKHHAFPEMWPATVALHHGYKAVFVPHPIYVDREWPTEYMARVYNAGKNGATGGSRNSVFGQREHNLRGLSWFYNSGFAPNLYRRWLGLKVNNDGGEEFELTPDMSKNDSNVGLMRGGEGRMCLPPMLVHPVKNVELPVEANNIEEVEVPESDPAA